jgi:YD repeat-containing protein
LIDARGGRTELEYDALDRLIRITYPDGLTESATYDAEGNQLEFVDRAGRATSYEYDAADQLLRTVHPDGKAPQIGYDAVGLSETDENGNQTTHT